MNVKGSLMCFPDHFVDLSNFMILRLTFQQRFPKENLIFMRETMVSFVIVVMYYGGDRAVFTELSLGQWHPCWWSLFQPGKCLNRFEQEATTKVWFWHWWCWCVGLLLWVGEGSGSGRSFLRVAPVARHQPRPHSAPGRRGREWHFDFLHRHTCIWWSGLVTGDTCW